MPQGNQQQTTQTGCPSISAGQLRDALPDKSVANQIGDGVSSYIQGVAWGATALAARADALGPDAQQQAINTNTQLASVGDFAAANPGQTASAVGAVVSKYPFQVAARVATGATVSFNFSAYVGIPVTLLAIYGTAFQDAYQNPTVVAAISVAGAICSKN
jgi:hypothetical protein